jgi:Chaperone of endosialidase
MKTRPLLLSICCAFTSLVNAQTINNTGTGYVGTPPGTNSQVQNAMDNQLMIQGASAFSTPALQNNIKFGIGYFPLNNIFDRVHVHDNTPSATAMRFSNTVTGINLASGFRVGINAAGHAALLQLENLPMRFATNATERMRILANGNVGINNTTGNNRLEITSGTGNPYFSTGFSSGLRLTNLPSTSVLTPNPGLGVLSVDGLGDVIYVPANTSLFNAANNGLSVSGTTVELGGLCESAAAASLLNDREIPMAGFNFSYTMPTASPSQFLIGNTSCTPGFPTRVLINNDFYNTGSLTNSIVASATQVAAGRFNAQNMGTGSAVAVVARALGSNTSANAIAVAANSTGSLSFDNIGVNAPTANATHASIGVNADITASTSPINQGHNTEIFGSTGTSNNTGASLTVNTPGNNNFGVYGYAAGGSFNAAIYGQSSVLNEVLGGTNWAGFFNGSTMTLGTVLPSDKRLKKDIVPINNALEIIKKLNPVTYFYDRENHQNIAFAGNKQYGFISQEVKEILPELTSPIVFPASYDTTGNEISPREEYLGLNYQGFTAIMVEAIQSQQKTIESQQQQIDELKALVQSMVNSGNTNPNIQNIELSDKNSIVLNQNVPNPFAESTVIEYSIPIDFSKAQLIFSTTNGTVIKSMDIFTKGKGTLNVFADDLSTGIYTYTLVVDGRTIETKKMMKQ